MWWWYALIIIIISWNPNMYRLDRWIYTTCAGFWWWFLFSDGIRMVIGTPPIQVCPKWPLCLVKMICKTMIHRGVFRLSHCFQWNSFKLSSPPFTVLVDGLVSLYFGLQVAGYAQLRPQKKLIKSSLFHGFSPIFGILKVFFNEFKCPKCRASHFFTRSMPIFCRLNHNILLVNYDQLPISSNPLDSAEPFPSPICVGLEIWSLR